MSDSRVIDLPDAETLDGTEVFYTVQDNDDRQVTLDELTNYTGGAAFFARFGASTGWLSGGLITQNADPAKIDISAGTGVITNATDPTTITNTLRDWSAFTGITPDFLLTNAATFFAIDVNGDLVQSATFPVDEGLRHCIQLGGVTHGDNTTITAISNFTSAVPFQLAPSLTDLIVALGVVNAFGNDYSGSGNANLKFMKSAGKDFYFGISSKTQPDDPNHIENAQEDEPLFIISWRDGSGGFTTKVSDAITAGVFDDGTGGATDPSGIISTNNWVNCRIRYSPDLSEGFIEYGDTSHGTSAGAVLQLGTDGYGDNPSFGTAPIRGYITLRGGATNNDIVGDAVFTSTNKFGDI